VPELGTGSLTSGEDVGSSWSSTGEPGVTGTDIVLPTHSFDVVG